MNVRWAKMLLGVVACLVLDVCVPTWASGSNQGQPKLAFWIATNNDSIFDNQILRFVANDANIVVINAPLSGTDGSADYARVVSQLHALNSHLPLLLYFWATRVYAGNTYGGVLRSGSVVTGNLPNMHSLLLKNPINGKVVHGARVWYGNVESAAYKQWMINRVTDVLKTTGADGVASDVAFRNPFPKWCVKKPNFCKRYAAGVDSLFADLKRAIKPKLVIFNGLWANVPGRLASQEKLLKYTDGAAIEWFGRRQNKPIPPFNKGILPYLKAMRAYPDKRLLVFGRGAISYSSYHQDYLWQRYLYAAYLMAAGPNTSFRYVSTFQSESPGRANMFTLYKDLTANIGLPEGSYRVHGDLYSRRFSNGLALLVPRGGRSESYTLLHTLYDSDGKSYKGKLIVSPGIGFVLFNRPLPLQPFKVTFAGDDESRFVMPDSRVVVPKSGTPFLAMKALPSARAWEHDLLLDPIKSLSPPLVLKIRMRTDDPSAKLFVVSAVDDSRRRSEQAVSVFAASTCLARKKGNLRISFRTSHPRLAHPQGCVSHFLKADGKWHTYTIPAAGVLPLRLKVRNWKYVRFEGTVDLEYVNQAGSA